jgi:hypothetical protein
MLPGNPSPGLHLVVSALLAKLSPDAGIVPIRHPAFGVEPVKSRPNLLHRKVYGGQGDLRVRRFRLDPQNRQLLRDGKPIVLASKAFDTG